MTAFDKATAAIASMRRAAATDRHRASLDVEFRPLGELQSLVEPWRDLAAAAVEPNIFFDPAFALAAAPMLGVNVVAGLVWTSGAPRQLVGVFPARIEKHRYALPLPVLVTWTQPFAPLGTPLVHRDMAEPAIAAWLDYVARTPDLPDLVLLRLFDEEGPFAAALSSVLARKGCAAKSLDRHRRALLAPGDQRDRYFERIWTTKQQKELRRQKRRLEELGPVTLEQASHGEELEHALNEFLALEASGWKGRAGTAALNNVQVRRFMGHAVTQLGLEGKALVHRLCVGGKPIAASILLKSGKAAWGWKIAYDENFSVYSPGVMLLAAMTETLLTDGVIDRVDSCAVGAHWMINRMWGERLAVTDCLITAEVESGYTFAVASRLEVLRRAAVATAKSTRDRIWRS